MKKGIGRTISIIAILTMTFQFGMPTVPVLQKETFAADTTTENLNITESEEISRDYEIKDEETWDISANGDGSVIAKWTLEDRTLTIYGTGKMKEWMYDSEAEEDWHNTQYMNVIENVVIEKGVTNIGNAIFFEAVSLKNIEIPEGITNIGNHAFHACSQLEKVILPKSVRRIEEYAFAQCSELTDIEIPNEVTYIGPYAFMSCGNLINVKIPTELTSIQNSVFLGCSSLPSIEIPQTVTNIGSYAFDGCDSLKEIEISSNVTSIGGYAFADCTSLENISVASNNKNYMSENGVLFNKSRNIILSYPAGKKDKEEYNIPSGVTSIAESAFEGTSLKYIKIPTTVKSIGHSAFANASNLQSIEIPKEVTYIGQSVFDFCYKLIIYVKADSEGHRWAEENGEGYVLDGEATKVSTSYELKDEKTWDVSLYEDGSAIAKWSLKDRTLTISGIGYIGISELNLEDRIYSELVEKVIIEEGIKEIGNRFFEDYHSLTSLEIPEGVKTIEQWVFEGCDNLESIKIPSTVINIGNTTDVFRQCYKLKNIEVDINNEKYLSEDGVLFNKEKTILQRYPPGKDDVKKYSIPKEVTFIGGNAFDGCSKLENIELPESVTRIGSEAFSGCSALTSINIPSNVTNIGNKAFIYCNNLESINIPYNITNIELETFSGCSSLTNVNIPNSVTTIGKRAFAYCGNLGKMSLSNKITSIEENAFYRSNVIIYTRPNSEVHKYVENNKIGYVIDEILPILKIDYNNKNLINQNVKVTITSNEEIQEVEGWTLSSDKKVLTKEYSANTKETITIKDLVGNEVQANIEISNIDKIAPNMNIEYSTKEPTNENVTVTITSNEEMQEVEGWTLSLDKKVLTKEYSENTKETIIVKDLAGNEAQANIEITNIDKTLPEIIIGDINLDEKIDVTDLLLLKRHLVAGSRENWKLTEDNLLAADINEDGNVDITDMLMLKRKIVNNM